MQERAIVLFTGDLKQEAARKGLPLLLLASLHRTLIDTIQRTPGISLIIASERASRFHLTAGDDNEQLTGACFAEKVDCAFRFAFSRGGRSVILLAGDVTGVDAALLDSAFEQLERGEAGCVIGPSGDGGFYLLGLTRSAGMSESIDWTRVPWFGAAAAATLLQTVRALGVGVSFVRSIDDVDSYGDAVRLDLLPSPSPAHGVTRGFAYAAALCAAVTPLRGPPAF